MRPVVRVLFVDETCLRDSGAANRRGTNRGVCGPGTIPDVTTLREAEPASGASGLLVRRCPVCDRDNSAESAHRLSKPPWRLVRCAGCGLVYLENPPTYEDLADEFAWEKTYTSERAARRAGRPVHYAVSDSAKRMKRLVRGGAGVKERGFITRAAGGGGRVLDVGCGNGRKLDMLPEGYTPFGVEISPALAAEAEARFSPRGGRVVRAPASEGVVGFGEGFFDAALLRSYLEHETQPGLVLDRLRAALRPGGRIIVKVPNFAGLNRRFQGRGWCGLRFPDHVNYFTPATLRRLLESSGYRIVRFSIAMRSPISDNMWVVAERPAEQ